MINKEDLLKKLKLFTRGKSVVDITPALQSCETPSYLIKAYNANKLVVRFSDAG